MVAEFASAIAHDQVRVLEFNRVLVGFVVIQRRSHELHLENVAVLPGLNGRGLGRLLVAFVEEEARSLGLSVVSLYTYARMHENLSLYRHLGYIETDRRYEDGFDRVYFEKRVRFVVNEELPRMQPCSLPSLRSGSDTRYANPSSQKFCFGTAPPTPNLQ